MLCDDRYKAVFGVKAPRAVAVFGFDWSPSNKLPHAMLDFAIDEFASEVSICLRR